MNRLASVDTLSGKEGRAYAKINGNNEEMFYARSINAKVEKTKAQVKAIGKRMVGHKTLGAEGTGSMTIYYMSPLFRRLLVEWKRTGVDAYFDMVIENSDPSSSVGTQTVLLSDVNLDSTVLAMLDGDSDDPLQEDVDFTFEDFDILSSFNN